MSLAMPVNSLTFLLDPQPWPEESYDYGLSILLSRGFLGIGSLVFSGTQHAARDQVVLCMSEPAFLKRIFLPLKWGEWAKHSIL